MALKVVALGDPVATVMNHFFDLICHFRSATEVLSLAAIVD